MTDQALPTGHTLGPPTRRRSMFMRLSNWDRVRVLLWSIVRLALFRFSPPVCGWWRRWLLRCFGAKVGRRVRIAPSVRVDFPWRLEIADDVVIMHGVILNCIGSIRIGAGALVSQYAHLCAGSHDYERADMPIVPRPIEVGRGVWIAADAFVGPGVTIGDGALLAARSSAFKHLPAGMVCIGEPARPVKPRTATTSADEVRP